MDDMHLHLSFMANDEEVAAQAAAEGILLFDNTVTPDEWRVDSVRFADAENVVVGFGMHPWWVGMQEEAATPWTPERVHELLEAEQPRILGEIGLDLGPRHEDTRDEQMAMFRTFAHWAGERGGKLLSIHGVKSAELVLDRLEASGAMESCTCIFHWFSGPSDQLKRAIDGGCFFSCGPRMLKSGKGKEYVRVIPEGRLLLETDAPAERGCVVDFAQYREELASSARTIADLKGPEVLDAIADSSRRLIGPDSPFRS